MALSVVLGFTGQLLYWLLFESFGRGDYAKKPKLRWNRDENIDHSVIIIGAGFSGIGMAIKLNEIGMDDYIVLERRAHLGGTWYDNQYPGCACDVPSNLYSFSFEPNPDWCYYFGRQPEIARYLEKCADKYDVRRHIEFETTLTDCKWLDDRQLWQVTVKSKNKERQLLCKMIMAGYGPLSNASYPTDIPGIDKFRGEMCHTAEWKKNIDFHNKRVAVVGTGASAAQVVPELPKMGVSQLVVFQRTAPWVIPRLDRRVTDWEKRLFARFPIIQKIIRGIVYWVRESTVLSFSYRWRVRFVNQELVEHFLRSQVKDEALRKKLTPTWELGCKRVLLSNDWYPTLQQPNVTLVTDRIREVTENSIVTRDGNEYPVDIIIWSTGFQVQKFSLRLNGVNGVSIEKQWGGTFQAFRGVTIPNFPNLFLLLGPNTGLGHNSVIVMIEAQLKYIVEALIFMHNNHIRAVSVKQESNDQFNKEIQRQLQTTVWQSGGCRSWYQDAKGNNTAIWPGFTWVYDLQMRKFDFQNYHLTPNE